MKVIKAIKAINHFILVWVFNWDCPPFGYHTP